MRERLILCHDCDLRVRVGAVPPGSTVRCPRCRARLLRHVRNSIDRTLSFALAGLLLFVVANSFPFLAMKMQGLGTETTLVTGVQSLYEQRRPLVASLVLGTTIVAPLLQLALLLYVLLPLRLGRRAPGQARCFRLLRRVQAWSMMEVFMIGVLVALVKLADIAEIVPGIALWAFVVLVPMMAASASSLDPDQVWDRIGYRA